MSAFLHSLQPRCGNSLPVEQWMKKMWFLHKMQYYSALKKFVQYFTVQINLEEVMLNEIRQSQGQTIHDSI